MYVVVVSLPMIDDLGRLDRNLQYPSLFQSEHKPIYNPLNFANPNYQPVFDRWQFSNVSLWESLIFTRDEVRVSNHQICSNLLLFDR